MILQPVINESGEPIPFTITEFDLVELCVVGYNEQFDWVTKSCTELDSKYNNREQLIEGFIRNELPRPIVAPDESLELRMIKDGTAYCIEIVNKTSDVSDEWGFFSAVPDEGKRFAIEHLANIVLCWATASCIAYDSNRELTWDMFYNDYANKLTRGLSIPITKGSNTAMINSAIDDFVRYDGMVKRSDRRSSYE